MCIYMYIYIYVCMYIYIFSRYNRLRQANVRKDPHENAKYIAAYPPNPAFSTEKSH